MERLLGLVCEVVVLDTVNEEQSGYGERASLSAGADTKANTMGSGGALQLLEHTVTLDAARNNEGGGNVQPLEREVDLLIWLCALELVDLKRVPVDTAKGRGRRWVSAGADKKANARESEERRVGVELSLWGANTLRGRAAAHWSDSSTGRKCLGRRAIPLVRIATLPALPHLLAAVP